MRRLFILALVALGFVCCKENLPVGPDIRTLRLPEIQLFTIIPVEILRYAPATLSWKVINARFVYIDQGIGKVGLVGTRIVRPEEMTTYTLTAQGGKGRASMAVTVTVIQPLLRSN